MTMIAPLMKAAGVGAEEDGALLDVADAAEAAEGDVAPQTLLDARAGRVGVMPSVSSMGPGAMALTRMPWRPHSTARLRVSASTPAFAAETWSCIGVPR